MASSAPRDRIVVLYIAGAGRSGSTLLDRMLGTLGATSTGELNRFWRHGVLLDHGCTCGVAFSECDYWREVVGLALGHDARATARRAIALQESVGRSRDFIRLHGWFSSASFRSAVEEYRSLLGRLYLALAQVSGNDVLIDSSKIPTEALLLAGIPELDVRVIHLVRDPRACVYSWRRHRVDPGHGGTQGKQSIQRTVAFWNTRNLLAGWLSHRLPYVRVTYEELTANPVLTLQQVSDSVGGVSAAGFRLHGAHSIELPGTHTLSGSPSRFRTGSIELRTDVEWREKMRPGAARTTTLLTAPLLARYGYPLRWREPMTRATVDAAVP